MGRLGKENTRITNLEKTEVSEQVPDTSVLIIIYFTSAGISTVK